MVQLIGVQKIDAWNERERRRKNIEILEIEKANHRRSEINQFEKTIKNSGDVTYALVKYLNHIETQKLKNNIERFKDLLITVFDLPLVENWQKPLSFDYSFKSYEQDHLHISHTEEKNYSTHIAYVTVFTINLCITKPNNYSIFNSYENRITHEDVENIKKMVIKFDGDLAFNLVINRKESFMIRNYIPMSDFFLK